MTTIVDGVFHATSMQPFDVRHSVMEHAEVEFTRDSNDEFLIWQIPMDRLLARFINPRVLASGMAFRVKLDITPIHHERPAR